MLGDNEIKSAAEALFQAEFGGEPAEPISKLYPEADINDAYRIAHAVTEAKLAAGRKVKGKKIGFTSKALRDLVGLAEPVYGSLFDNWFVDEGASIPGSRLNTPAVEIELAFILKHDLSGPHVNAVDVIRATDFVMPAFEIVDSRYKERGPNFIVDSIADSASCGLVILGGRPMKLTDMDIRQIGGALSKNGVVEVSGTAAGVMGNPIYAIAWLSRKLHEFDLGLRAGETIISGSFVQMIPIDKGDAISADFGPLGGMQFGVV